MSAARGPGHRSTATAGVLTTRDAVRNALIDYKPDAPGDPITFRAGRLEFLDPGIVLWRDDYEFSFYFDGLN